MAGDAASRRPRAMAAVRRAARESSLASAASAGSLDTSYVCVVDEFGNGFSATPSDPSVDSPVVPGVGCVVSPRGSRPGSPPATRASWRRASAPGSRRLPRWCFETGASSCRSARRAATSSSRQCSRCSSTSPPTACCPSMPSRCRAWPREASPTRSGLTPTPRATRRRARHSHRHARRPGRARTQHRRAAGSRLALGCRVRGRRRPRWHADGGRGPPPRGPRHRVVGGRGASA